MFTFHTTFGPCIYIYIHIQNYTSQMATWMGTCWWIIKLWGTLFPDKPTYIYIILFIKILCSEKYAPILYIFIYVCISLYIWLFTSMLYFYFYIILFLDIYICIQYIHKYIYVLSIILTLIANFMYIYNIYNIFEYVVSKMYTPTTYMC